MDHVESNSRTSSTTQTQQAKQEFGDCEHFTLHYIGDGIMNHQCSSFSLLLLFLQESDVRIIIGQFREESASEVFCCVSTCNGQKYVDTHSLFFDMMKGNLNATTHSNILLFL